MFTIKQHDNVTGSGRKTRVDKDLAARQNAASKQANLEAKEAREVLRQEQTRVEEAEATEVVSEEPETSKPRRSRRNTRTSNLR